MLEIKIGWGKRGSVSAISLGSLRNCTEKILVGGHFFVAKRICPPTVTVSLFLVGYFEKEPLSELQDRE